MDDGFPGAETVTTILQGPIRVVRPTDDPTSRVMQIQTAPGRTYLVPLDAGNALVIAQQLGPSPAAAEPAVNEDGTPLDAGEPLRDSPCACGHALAMHVEGEGCMARGCTCMEFEWASA